MTDTRKVVPSAGPIPAKIMLVGSAPGPDDPRRGEPFMGREGKELDNLLRMNKLRRADIYRATISKVVPEDHKKGPTPEDYARFSTLFEFELKRVNPQIIIAMGRHTVAHFLGKTAKLADVHGLVFNVEGRTVIPVMHPSATFSDGSNMEHVAADFALVGRIASGITVPAITIEGADPEEPEYEDSLERGPVYRELVADPFPILAVDTETVQDRIFSSSVTWRTGQALFIHKDDTEGIALISTRLEQAQIIAMHNAKYDLRMLQQIGIRVNPLKMADTMIMSHLIGWERALKKLTYRTFGIRMREYQDLISDFGKEVACEYFERILARQWEKPAPEIKIHKGGVVKKRQPQGVETRVRAILTAVREKGADPYDRWKKYKLKDGRGMVERELGMIPEANVSHVPREKLVQYACMDSDYTFQLYHILSPQIAATGQRTALAIDHGILGMLADMEARGILVDTEYMRCELKTQLQEQISHNAAVIMQEAGHLLNPNASGQIKNALYEMELFDSREQSTAAKYLRARRGEHPIFDAIVLYREASKLLGTYVDTLHTYVKPDGAIHTRFNPAGARTGRLASSDPNLQNQPVRSALGRKIRNAFKPRQGFVLVGTDYSQIEMRVAAHLSRDAFMTEVFQRGLDIHSETAAKMWGIPISEVDEKKHRYPAKRVGFGILYGISAKGLWEQMVAEGIFAFTVEDCREMIRAWYRVYTGIKEYSDAIGHDAIISGEVRDMFGRRRVVAEAMAEDSRVRAEGMRKAVNMPVQAGAQNILKLAMAKLYRNTDIGYEDYTFPLVQIHDEILWEIRADKVLETYPIICDIMATVTTLRVPLKVDADIGDDWGSLVSAEKYRTSREM